MQEIIIACISAGSAVVVGVMTLVGVIITNNKAKAEFGKQVEIALAVMDEKIQDLTREVRKHNGFAERMPELKAEIDMIKKIIEMYHKGD